MVEWIRCKRCGKAIIYHPEAYNAGARFFDRFYATYNRIEEYCWILPDKEELKQFDEFCPYRAFPREMSFQNDFTRDWSSRLDWQGTLVEELWKRKAWLNAFYEAINLFLDIFRKRHELDSVEEDEEGEEDNKKKSQLSDCEKKFLRQLYRNIPVFEGYIKEVEEKLAAL